VKIGDTVRILAPFDETYSDEYVITDQVDLRTFVLGDIGAFDIRYLDFVK
jgi:hypothetical protein